MMQNIQRVGVHSSLEWDAPADYRFVSSKPPMVCADLLAGWLEGKSGQMDAAENVYQFAMIRSHPLLPNWEAHGVILPWPEQTSMVRLNLGIHEDARLVVWCAVTMLMIAMVIYGVLFKHYVVLAVALLLLAVVFRMVAAVLEQRDQLVVGIKRAMQLR